MKLAITGIVLSMFDRLNNAYGTAYDPKGDVVAVSVPDLGPKSLDINSNQIEDFAAALANFKPDQSLSLVATVEKTLERVTVKEVPSIRFRTSLEKGSRAVTVAESEWPDFVRFWSAAAESMPDLHERYKAQVEEAGE